MIVGITILGTIAATGCLILAILGILAGERFNNRLAEVLSQSNGDYRSQYELCEVSPEQLEEWRVGKWDIE